MQFECQTFAPRKVCNKFFPIGSRQASRATVYDGCAGKKFEHDSVDEAMQLRLILLVFMRVNTGERILLRDVKGIEQRRGMSCSILGVLFHFL